MKSIVYWFYHLCAETSRPSPILSCEISFFFPLFFPTRIEFLVFLKATWNLAALQSVNYFVQITGNSFLMGYIVGIPRSHSLWEEKCSTKTANLPKSSAVWKFKQLIAQSFLSEWLSWFEWNKKIHTIL